MSHAAMNWATNQQAGSANAKALLLVLADLADHQHQCWPSRDHMAVKAEQSHSAVMRSLRMLEERGLLSRQARTDERGAMQSSLITLHVAAGA